MGFAQGHAKVGGRKKGTPNKQELPLARALREAREKAEREVAADPNCDAHSLLRMVYLDTTLPIEVRIDAAKAAIGYELPKLNAIDARIDAVSHPESAADLVFRERQLLGRTFHGLGLPSPKVIEGDEVIVGDGVAVDGT